MGKEIQAVLARKGDYVHTILFKRDVDNSVLFDFFRRRPGSELA